MAHVSEILRVYWLWLRNMQITYINYTLGDVLQLVLDYCVVLESALELSGCNFMTRICIVCSAID